MFRGLSSWLGLKQPEGAAAVGEPPSGDELSAGDAPPEEHPEQPTQEEPQPAEDPELLHQARGLGSESPPGREGGLEGDAGMEVGETGSVLPVMGDAKASPSRQVVSGMSLRTCRFLCGKPGRGKASSVPPFSGF